ncbi:hypothetical protein HK097_001944 [Rhizophlyctis rosea]|uniref:Uncharacterized protein n=1 Tax=Rhizophlyctis rosea TaxID=64517 RepID=A0AAD5SGP2_9FUNG|nr:hypothetical protein HK097_001944 [Rhizophlyctis rosea]
MNTGSSQNTSEVAPHEPLLVILPPMQVVTAEGNPLSQTLMMPVSAVPSTTPIRPVLFFPPSISSRLPRPAEPRPVRNEHKSRAKPYVKTTAAAKRPSKSQPAAKPPEEQQPPQPIEQLAPCKPPNYCEPAYDNDEQDNIYRLNWRALSAIRNNDPSTLSALLADGAEPVTFFDNDYGYVYPTSHPLWVAATYQDPTIYDILVAHLFRQDHDHIETVKSAVDYVVRQWITPIPPVVRILNTLSQYTDNPESDIHPIIRRIVDGMKHDPNMDDVLSAIFSSFSLQWKTTNLPSTSALINDYLCDGFKKTKTYAMRLGSHDPAPKELRVSAVQLMLNSGMPFRDRDGEGYEEVMTTLAIYAPGTLTIDSRSWHKVKPWVEVARASPSLSGLTWGPS